MCYFLLINIFDIRVGGSIPVIFSYFTEFQPKDRRGKMISALATFWMFGNIIAAGKNTEYYVPLTYSVFTMARAVHIGSAI